VASAAATAAAAIASRNTSSRFHQKSSQLPPQVVEDERQRGPREQYGQADDRQHRDEAGEIVRMKGGGVRAEQAAQGVGPVGRLVEAQVDRGQQRDEGPQRDDQQALRDARQRRHGEAAQGDAQHEYRHHHREGELRGAEGEAAQADQHRLHGHHGEAHQQGDGGPVR
jgi:hypothetical protein